MRCKNANAHKEFLKDAMQVWRLSYMDMQNAAILSNDESVTKPSIKLCEIIAKMETKITWNYDKNSIWVHANMMDERMRQEMRSSPKAPKKPIRKPAP